jgi:hypothetical protein
MSDIPPNVHLEELANGAPYPITKEALIAYARQQSLDESLIDELHHLTENTFNTCDHLIRALTKPSEK